MVSAKDTVTQSLKAVADSTRRAILELLKDRELSVLEIAEEFPMSRPAISKHLRILKEAGLVVEQPAGRQRIYMLDKAPLLAVGAWLSDFGARNGGRSLVSGAPAARSGGVSASRTALRAADRNGWRNW